MAETRSAAVGPSPSRRRPGMGRCHLARVAITLAWAAVALAWAAIAVAWAAVALA